jgi:hypothetical protein
MTDANIMSLDDAHGSLTLLCHLRGKVQLVSHLTIGLPVKMCELKMKSFIDVDVFNVFLLSTSGGRGKEWWSAVVMGTGILPPLERYNQIWAVALKHL